MRFHVKQTRRPQGHHAMTDLIERARSYVHNLGGDPQDYLVWQLADEIERLTEIVDQEHPKLIAEIERLKREAKAGDLAAIIRQQGFEIERLRTDNHKLMMWNAELQEKIDALASKNTKP
jgi:hypothetical protein